MKKCIEVIKRELDIWRRRPIYLAGSVGVMLFCAIFYLTFMQEGVPHDLPIGVVDYDNSSLTRNFIQQLDATQLGKVVHYDSFSDAREDMQSGKITAVCVLPEGMYADVQAQRRPEFTFYVNTLYFLGGSLSYKNILTMINLTSGAVQRQVLRMKGVNENAIMGRLRPINIDVHQIGNSLMSYGSYLSNMLLPAMLQMVIIIITIYSLGTELKYDTAPQLLQLTSGSITKAVGGKMMLYTALFTAMAFAMQFTLYGWMHVPYEGNVGWMLLCAVFFVLACESIGIFIIGCIPVLRFAISVGALFSVLALSLTGFTLPVEAMPGPIRSMAYMFPLRHYYLLYVQDGIFARGFEGCCPELLRLTVFFLLPLTVLHRLKGAYVRLDYPKK